jgi:protein-S-isoprenylcysteine O-methyltransferase Ste14
VERWGGSQQVRMVLSVRGSLALLQLTLSAVGSHNMIERSRLSRMWKRTVFHLIAVDIFAVAIVINLIIKRMNTESGPTWSEIILISVTLIAGSWVFYLVARSIKNGVWRKYGEEDKSSK